MSYSLVRVSYKAVRAADRRLSRGNEKVGRYDIPWFRSSPILRLQFYVTGLRSDAAHFFIFCALIQLIQQDALSYCKLTFVFLFFFLDFVENAIWRSVYFDYIALYFDCRLNENSLLECYISVFFTDFYLLLMRSCLTDELHK